MNARLLLAALKLIESDYTSLAIREKLSKLVNAAANAAGSPSDAATQKQFTDAIEATRTALRSAKANTVGISLRKTIADAGLLSLVGEHIDSKLNGIISRTPFLLPQASEAIQALHGMIEKDYVEKLKAAVDALSKLRVTPLGASSQLSEIGVLIPTRVMQDDLIETNRNLKDWERVFRDLAEVTKGRPPSQLKIASVSSGSFELYLNFDMEGAKALAIVVSVLVGGFLALTKARKRRVEMEAEGYPEKLLNLAKEHERDIIRSAETQATEAVLKMQSSELSEARVNELKTAVRRDVQFIARSINQGVDVEVSPPQIPEGTPVGPAVDQQLLKDLRELSAKINGLTRTLPDRKEPIAELPETEAPQAS